MKRREGQYARALSEAWRRWRCCGARCLAAQYRALSLFACEPDYYNLDLKSTGEIPILSMPTPLLQAVMWSRDMMTHMQYQYLEPHPSSNYCQLWVKGRHIRAEVLYRLTVGTEPRTPQEVAQDYDLPVEAVQEAIDYAVRNQELLEAERADEECRMQQLSLDKSSFVPANNATNA